MAEPCQRCLALEQSIAAMRDELAEVGRPVTDHETLADNDCERELAKWLRVTPEPDAAAGYHAGWVRLGRLVTPRFRDWQRIVFETNREGDRLRARVGNLLREISRLNETG
jgi:hypothetical protein